MNKIWLVIKREYLTRVRNKTFLLSTILLPVGNGIVHIGQRFFCRKIRSKKKIAVEDKQSELANFLKSDSSKMEFTFNTGVDTSNFAEKGYDGFLYAVDSSGRHFLLKTVKAASNETMDRLKNKLNSAYISNKLLEKNISIEQIDSINSASTSYYTG
jgi:ABC-2 type transport system permease protein